MVIRGQHATAAPGIALLGIAATVQTATEHGYRLMDRYMTSKHHAISDLESSSGMRAGAAIYQAAFSIRFRLPFSADSGNRHRISDWDDLFGKLALAD
jgi:hypothetical protein